MKNQFVTYEIALKFKEINFDEECLYSFEYGNGGLECKLNPQLKTNSTCNIGEIVASLWQQCVDWFREKHKINIFFDCEMNISSMEVDWFKYRYIDRIWSNKGCYNGSEIYEEAREQAILKCIELYKKNYHKN